MERIKLAEKIISTCREMNASGLNQGTSGNVSARYTGGMLITPSGIAYSKMTPDMIVFVDDKEYLKRVKYHQVNGYFIWRVIKPDQN